jgi:hypothetical protein
MALRGAPGGPLDAPLHRPARQGRPAAPAGVTGRPGAQGGGRWGPTPTPAQVGRARARILPDDGESADSGLLPDLLGAERGFWLRVKATEAKTVVSLHPAGSLDWRDSLVEVEPPLAPSNSSTSWSRSLRGRPPTGSTPSSPRPAGLWWPPGVGRPSAPPAATRWTARSGAPPAAAPAALGSAPASAAARTPGRARAAGAGAAPWARPAPAAASAGARRRAAGRPAAPARSPWRRAAGGSAPW